MQRTCARALEIGVPAVAFTEHVDRASWRVLDSDLVGHEHLSEFVTDDGVLTPRELDLKGYLEELDRCREMYPHLLVIGGVELGEPHWYPKQTLQLQSNAEFDVVLGSVHGLRVGGEFSEPPRLFRSMPAVDVIRAYLAEVMNLIDSPVSFHVLAHIDYPVRYWPETAGSFTVNDFEDEFRSVLRRLARSGRALELNTRIPFHSEFLRWWREEGGQDLSFGSDAHSPEALGHDFDRAARLAEAHGFRPGRRPDEFWISTAL